MIHSLTPKPNHPNAERFVQTYGNQFMILGIGALGLKLTLQPMPVGRILCVEKRDEGIFVDGNLFCVDWA